MGGKKKRDAYLDIVKGIAIIAVVIGHCIQFGSGIEWMKGDFFYNNVFRFIYSWHMPLFMLVSGYLFSFSVKRHDLRELVTSRFQQLVLPMMSWGMLITIASCVLGWDSGTFAYNFFKHFLNDIWFLWAIFYNSLLVLAIRRLFADNIGVYVGLYMLTFFVPDSFNAALYKFMYPFFVSAYLYGSGKLLRLETVFVFCNKMQSLLLAVSVYAGLFSMYGYYAYVYTSGYAAVDFRSLLVNPPASWVYSDIVVEWKFWNDIYRMLIGFAGAAVIMLLVRVIYDNSRVILGGIWSVLQNIGIASLAIYILSGYINGYVLPRICRDFEFNYVMTIMESIFVVIECYVGFVIIRRQRIANKLLLGGR